MGFIYFLFYIMPVILAFEVIYLITCIVQKRRKAAIVNIVLIFILSFTLLIYYQPQEGILDNRNLESLNINLWSSHNFKVDDKRDVDRLFNTINKYKFIRSAVKTIEGESIYGNDYVIISATDYKARQLYSLYVFGENPEKGFLQINGQCYNIWDAQELSKEVISIAKEIAQANFEKVRDWLQ